MCVSAYLIHIVIALVSVLVYYVRRHLAYWKHRGIQHDKPDFPEGNMKGYLKDRHYRDIIKEHYDKFKSTGPLAGFFLFLTPAVVVFDLNLIKNILDRDFHNFTDRGIYYNERDDPLTGHLISLDGEKWRRLRNKLAPCFTSGKMRFMFPTVVSVGEHLQETIGAMIEADPIVEVTDLMARFTVDVIGSCAFGLVCDSLNDPSAKFRVMGGKAFSQPRHNRIIQGLVFSFPELARKLRLRIIHEEVHEFFMSVVRATVNFREKHLIQRNDFMNLLIKTKNSDDGMTIEELAAQVFIFFVTGFETSSATMSFALFELAVNQDIQDKLRAEINEKLRQHDGNFTFDCMAEMDYMRKVVKETLRKYTVLVCLVRKALNDYVTSDSKYTIPKGSFVLIPADAIHRDPEIYPDPEKFDPERFSHEETQKRHPCTWLPFGGGPRNCIGLRFGKMQTYIALALLVKNYKFHCCDRTGNPLELDPTKPFVAIKGGICLRVERL